MKTDAQLPRSERPVSIMHSGVLLPPPVGAGVLEPGGGGGGGGYDKVFCAYVLTELSHDIVCATHSSSRIPHTWCMYVGCSTL